MLDIDQSVSSQDSRIFKVQEKEVIFNETRSIEDQARLIENHKKIIYVEF